MAKIATQSAVSFESSLALFEQMVLLRRFELTVQDQYKKGRMPGFLHLYIGQEAVATGVCAHLRREDWITSTASSVETGSFCMVYVSS